MKSIKDEINEIIEAKRDLLIHLSHSIWDLAETRFEEYQSAALLCKVLTDEGFRVTQGIADIDTAFVAEFGDGKPVIGFLGEYDALYGLSQAAGVTRKKPLIDGGKGHGCGHHALGVSGLAAAIGVKEFYKEHHLQGTIRYYGCPAEESGSGKVYMARAGYFKDLDVALTSHPGNKNSVTSYNCLATLQVYFRFYGISSHAAASPHLGRSALDAVELMNVGSNYLREHVPQDVRIHYAITDSGGLSPNIVQSKASVMYQIRAPKISQAKEVYERVVKIAQGASLMTDTKVVVDFDRASSNWLPNRTLEKLIHEKFGEFGPVPLDNEDIQLAKEIRETLSEAEKDDPAQVAQLLFGEKAKNIIQSITGKEIVDILYPYIPVDIAFPASTDVGDVSWNVPTVEIMTACFASGTPLHSWQAVAQGKSELCHKGMLHAGKVMALSAVELFGNLELLQKVKNEFMERLGGKTYDCPIPAEILPPPRRSRS